ncbi:MAG: hypothetical protein WCP91_01995 [Candidatus Berkelbacteria bacterium]
MDKKEFNKAHEEAMQKKLLEEPDYWFKPRRQKWDEWGSPVGLGIWGALWLFSAGIFIYLLHLSGIL